MSDQMIFNEVTNMAYPYNKKILKRGAPWIVLNAKEATERAQDALAKRLNVSSKENDARAKTTAALLKGKPAGGVPTSEPTKSAKKGTPSVIADVVVPEVSDLTTDMLQ
jgi:hypothetical protein